MKVYLNWSVPVVVRNDQDDQDLVKLCLSNTYYIFWIIRCTKILEGIFRGEKILYSHLKLELKVLNKMSVQYAVCVYYGLQPL
jgi:hypothetical protein